MKLEALRTVDYVVLPCSDLVAMLTFYRDRLRLIAGYQRADWVEFKLENITLALRPREEPLFQSARTALPAAAVQLAFRVPYSRVDEWFQKLSDLDIPILDPPADQTWGHRTLYFSDPEGNVVEIYADIAIDGSTP